jgi:hypothetical protein
MRIVVVPRISLPGPLAGGAGGYFKKRNRGTARSTRPVIRPFKPVVPALFLVPRRRR